MAEVQKPASSASPVSRAELFLRAVEARTDDPTHRRILRASRDADVRSAIENELGKIVSEILHEA
jgi:hypothetical protein